MKRLVRFGVYNGSLYLNSLSDDAKGNPEVRNESLRIAIAGAGKMAGEHLRAIDELENLARVVGVVDPSEEARNGLLDRLVDAQGAGTLAHLLRIKAGLATSGTSGASLLVESDFHVSG